MEDRRPSIAIELCKRMEKKGFIFVEEKSGIAPLGLDGDAYFFLLNEEEKHLIVDFDGMNFYDLTLNEFVFNKMVDKIVIELRKNDDFVIIDDWLEQFK